MWFPGEGRGRYIQCWRKEEEQEERTGERQFKAGTHGEVVLSSVQCW